MKKSLIKTLIIIVFLILLIVGGIILYTNYTACPSPTECAPILNIEISLFNSQFEIYEGVITGTNVKKLVKVVEESNIANPDNKVTINNIFLTDIPNIKRNK